MLPNGRSELQDGTKGRARGAYVRVHPRTRPPRTSVTSMLFSLSLKTLSGQQHGRRGCQQ